MKALIILLLVALLLSVSAVSPPEDFGIAGYYAKALVERRLTKEKELSNIFPEDEGW